MSATTCRTQSTLPHTGGKPGFPLLSSTRTWGAYAPKPSWRLVPATGSRSNALAAFQNALASGKASSTFVFQSGGALTPFRRSRFTFLGLFLGELTVEEPEEPDLGLCDLGHEGPG